jgi:hypothetical protein
LTKSTWERYELPRLRAKFEPQGGGGAESSSSFGSHWRGKRNREPLPGSFRSLPICRVQASGSLWVRLTSWRSRDWLQRRIGQYVSILAHHGILGTMRRSPTSWICHSWTVMTSLSELRHTHHPQIEPAAVCPSRVCEVSGTKYPERISASYMLDNRWSIGIVSTLLHHCPKIISYKNVYWI